ELLLKGKDFQGIMEFSADKVDFGIVLYNLFMEVLCCSNYEGDKNLPANIMEMSEMKILSRQKIPQVINISRNRQILLFPVISGERLRGFLSAQVPEKGFTAKDRIFLDYLCQAFALIWLRKIAFEEAEQKLKNEILTGLLEGNYGEDIQKKAGSYGLHNNNMSFVMMISVENVEDHHLFCQERKGAFLLNFINNYLDQKGIANIIIPEGNDICIIASYKELKRKNNRYDNIITEIMDDIYGQFPYLMLGSGRIYPGLFNIRTSYMEAGQCMVIINKYFIHRKMVSFGDMGVMRLLLTQKKEDVDAYLLDILGPIIAYDKKKNTNLMETLFYYCRLNKSLNYVSQKLNIHANTLYLRIKKAEELMGMDLENSMDWLDIQSASILYGLMYTDLISKL
ncbi:MAG: helix-turn-helix domain-containing protein, partial [Clostridiales bacterium]